MHLKQEKGFTLVEILVVSVLLSILSSILYGSITGIMRGRNLVRGQLETVRVSQYIIEKIGRELSSATVTPLFVPGQNSTTGDVATETNTDTTQTTTGSNPFANIGGSAGFGVRGRAVTELTNAKTESGDKDSITFVSAQSSQLLKGSSSNFGSVQISYRLEKDFKELTDESDNDNSNIDRELYSLVRSEFPAGASIDQRARDFRSYEYSLANNVSSLNFRFYVDGQWQSTFDGNTGRLPEAVEVSISLKDSEGSIESFRTSFAVGGQ